MESCTTEAAVYEGLLQPDDSSGTDKKQEYHPPSPAFGQAAVLLLAQHLDCIITGTWARLVLKHAKMTSIFNFSCTSPPHMRKLCCKCPANAQREKQQKHERKALGGGKMRFFLPQ
jgi:hypothetical protein